MVELDRVLNPIAKHMNSCYESLFPDLCQYPQFSFNRAMIILWKKKVYLKIKSNLIDSFVTLLREQRAEEIKIGKSKCKDFSCLSVLCTSDTNNSELLARFVQSVVDLSVNELTVHYLGSTKAQLHEPYEELNKVVLQQTRDFYHKAGESMRIKCCRETLESDYKMLENIVLPCTLKEVCQLKQNHMEKYFRYYIQRRLSQFKKEQRNAEEADVDREEAESGVFRYIKQLVSGDENAERTAKQFYRHFSSAESAVLGMYEEVMSEREEEECQKDIEIDFINQKRGVPFELSPEESLLYGYTQSVTLKVLENIKEKYEQETVCLEHIPVSYTHLTLPTIYSV
eukprot:TRINITY_DN1552_c0_g1_i17.p1 TRINITY_DN1552_c0_g1~~TRINITY_DN1552_c0_g1_i17.p1  ORF type:complete len:341 (-),score=108.51 TRINITY_DN1552_c0_g1_i17:46-1068(-)